MAPNFGTGVSRTLNPDQSGVVTVVYQRGKPPMDADLNLGQQISQGVARDMLRTALPSGWLGDGVNVSDSYGTDASWSNWFKFGSQRSGEKGAIEWAAVNGWLLPIVGTRTGSPPGSPDNVSTWNRITLDPPPGNAGDSRIDYVFLEAWEALVAPNPSTTNKPAASALYRYGNVEGGMGYITDDLKDPNLNFEVTRRVQRQYRIRVVSGMIGLTTYPDGFDPTLVKAQGASSTVTNYTFTNMGSELGDPGLWRAGDGTANALGTVDGYVYAVPICAVFRRNSVAWDGDPGQNLNGAFNRNPTAVDRTGYKTFSTVPTLSGTLSAAATSFTLASATNIPLPTAPAGPVAIQINDEIILYSAITSTTVTVSQRGAYGTKAVAHPSGSTIRVLSGAPDGLFSDQIARTDILDLRHVVSPTGFDYDSLLKTNLDKLLKGELRSHWKRSGAGPQGPFVRYQDKISNSAAALGVTKLDGPDSIRTVFSDAAVQQPIDLFVNTAGGGSGAAWSLSLTCSSVQAVGNQYSSGDTITIPIAQFKTGLPGSDVDQVRFLGTGDGTSPVSIRIDGESQPLSTDIYTVTPANPTSSDNLVITLAAGFPAATTRSLIVRVNVLYGPGRGLARRPDAVHSIAYTGGSSDIMTQLSGIPTDNIPLRAGWLPLWSRNRGSVFYGQLPVTAEAYVDPGSKSVAITPFRRITLPATLRSLDGSYSNVDQTVIASGASGSTAGTTTFTDLSANFAVAGVTVGHAVIITSPTGIAGRYTVTGGVAATSLTLDRTVPTHTSIQYTIRSTQGVMPTLSSTGAAKWTTTDPLGLFSGSTEATASTKNLYVELPQNLMPTWGEVHVPIIHSDTTTTPPGGSSTFDEGINFGVLTKKGDRTSGPDAEKNFVGFGNGALSYAPLSTKNLVSGLSATYNATFTFGGNTFAGTRFFTDTRGMGRTGIELPPFYGVARLFAVYEAADYQVNGSAYHPTTRVPTGGGATNLLRQSVSGPTFWIETDDDSDSTFILNSAAIDITKSPNPIASFAAGHYVIEASLFGFDRGSFDSGPCKLVLSRARAAGQAKSGSRSDNYGTGSAAAIAAPILCVPGPATVSDEIVVNYSRTPYGGDPWGTQTNLIDIGLKQGPLLSGTAYQVSSTTLDQANLTRPYQKVVEVLSSTAFITTAGTGRLSGDCLDTGFDVRNVGYEDTQGYYPPPSNVSPRPNIKLGALKSDERILVMGTQYGGCTERLPLGALLRDKDFRGGLPAGAQDADYRSQVTSNLVFTEARSPGTIATGVAVATGLEQSQLNVNTTSVSSGQPGEVLVFVDGEQGNYGTITNFRTNRGGSVFVGGGSRPGGEIQAAFDAAGSHPAAPAVLCGIAMLVRNVPTSVGAVQVSAGGELMLAIVTSGDWLASSGRQPRFVVCGTQGTNEGYAAADLYRIDGHPLEYERGENLLNPATIQLSPAFDPHS